MRRATIHIVGISPWLIDPMPAATLEGLRKGGKMENPKGEDKEKVALSKFYRDEEGIAGVPMDNVIACLVEAGRSVKKGKSKISTKDTTQLFDIITDFSPLFVRFANLVSGKKEPKWVADVRRGVGHNVKPPVAVAITRPRLDEVVLAPITIDYDDTKADISLMLELFRVAGTSNGLCGARPNKGRMLFGRFKVSKWEETSIVAAEDTLEIYRDGQRITRTGQPWQAAAA